MIEAVIPSRDAPSRVNRVMIVDGSKLTRRLISEVMHSELPAASVLGCENAAQAQQHVQEGSFDLITTALRLADMDGLQLARQLRTSADHARIPIIVISGDVQNRLEARSLGGDVTDYFDKALGLDALAEFIRGYARPLGRSGDHDDGAERFESTAAQGHILYVEDSRVIALTVSRLLENQGFRVHHATSVDDALVRLGNENAPDFDGMPIDLVLTDIRLRGELTGADLLARIRGQLRLAKGRLPVIVMTADENPANQTALLRAGANDLVSKPIDEQLLITKLRFQLRVARRHRAGVATRGEPAA